MYEIAHIRISQNLSDKLTEQNNMLRKCQAVAGSGRAVAYSDRAGAGRGRGRAVTGQWQGRGRGVAGQWEGSSTVVTGR